MYWTKEEGYWCGRGDVKWCWVSWRCSFNWNWIFTQRGGHVHWWLKGWEVLALLDHHHFHLHLHLLHHHIHRRQCPLHCSGIQYLWIDKKTTKVVSLNVKMCHVLQRIHKIFTQIGPYFLVSPIFVLHTWHCVVLVDISIPFTIQLSPTHLYTTMSSLHFLLLLQLVLHLDQNHPFLLSIILST